MPRLCLGLLALAFPAVSAAASLSHSGYLLDGSDEPVNTPVSMSFTISDSPVSAGETVLWSATCPVTPAHGYYSVTLGPDGCGGALPATVTAPNGPRYLGVTVGTTSLSPRLLLAPVTYADIANGLTASAIAPLVQKSELGTLPLAPTGTADATTFLRGDGTWAVPPTNTGPQGPAGSSWRTGSGAPAAALGADGDFYLDTNPPNAFYVRVNGAYVQQGSLQGSAAPVAMVEKSSLRLSGDDGAVAPLYTTRKFGAVTGQSGANDYTVDLANGTVTVNTSGLYAVSAWGTFNVQNNLYQVSRNEPTGATITNDTLAGIHLGGGAIAGTAFLAAGDVVRVQYANPSNGSGGTATSPASHFFAIRRLADATSEKSYLRLTGDAGNASGSATARRFTTLAAQTGGDDYTVDLANGTVTLKAAGLYAVGAWGTFSVQNNFFVVSKNAQGAGISNSTIAGSSVGGGAISGAAVLQVNDVIRLEYGNPQGGGGNSNSTTGQFLFLRRLADAAPEKSLLRLLGDAGNAAGSSTVRRYTGIAAYTGSPDYGIDLVSGAVTIQTAGTYAISAWGTYNVQNNFHLISRNGFGIGPSNSTLAGGLLGGGAISATAVLVPDDVIRIEYGNPNGGGGTATDPLGHFMMIRRLD